MLFNISCDLYMEGELHLPFCLCGIARKSLYKSNENGVSKEICGLVLLQGDNLASF